MAVGLDQFIKQLEDSGIIEPGKLDSFLPPQSSPKDAQDLALELVRNNQLTRFQAQAIYQGNGNSLLLGNYIILDKIGAGGMGEVYKAQHRRMDRIVAIKTLSSKGMSDPRAIARFEREVRSAARLEHPNIVTAYDADQAEGVHFLVMQYVDGSDLAKLVKQDGPLSVDQAVACIVQAARGLEAAHAEGIVHRDVKPANLLLDNKGAVTVLDMGLARLDSGPGQTIVEADLTNSGAIMGTFDYMAPEQALNTKHADARADIYSLGCTFYYLLTGMAPFDGETVMEKVLAHREQPIPTLQDIRDDVSDELDAVFCTMIAKCVEDRYQLMSEVVADLERLGDSRHHVPGLTGVSTKKKVVTLQDEPAHDMEPALGEEIAVGASRKKLIFVAAGFFGTLVVLAAILARLPTAADAPPNEPLPDDDKPVVLVPNNAIPAIEEPPVLIDINRAAAEWVFSVASNAGVNNSVSITTDDGRRLEVLKLVDLPPEHFRLVGINLWGNSQTTDEGLAQLESLKDLTYFGNNGGGITDAGLFHLRNVISLMSLDLTGVHVTDIGMGHLAGLSHLEILSISGTGVTDDGMRQLAGLVRMKRLALHDTLVTDAGLAHLHGMTRLRQLDIGQTRVTNTGLKHLAPFKELEELNLSDLPIINDGLASVGQLAWLRNLDLRGTQISDNGLVWLTKLRKIETLSLDGVGISDAGLAHLKSLITLRHLSINGTKATQAGVKELRSVLPRCRIVFDDGVFEPQETVAARLHATALVEKRPSFVKGQFKPLEVKQVVVETQPGSPTEGMKPLAFETPKFDKWIKDVAELPAQEQVEAVSKKLMELNPGFDGNVTYAIEDGVVIELEFLTASVIDISPVAGLPKLKKLVAEGSPWSRNGRVADLSPLKGMKLLYLGCSSNPITDLSPLKGMPLTELLCVCTQVADLSPLRGAQLTNLCCIETAVSDLSPLEGMPLWKLECYRTKVSDLTPLQHMKTLRDLRLGYTQVSDLSPLKGLELTFLECNNLQISEITPLKDLPLEVLNIETTLVTDLSPLKKMPLRYLTLDFKPERDTALLRSIKTLNSINAKPVAAFWKDVRAASSP